MRVNVTCTCAGTRQAGMTYIREVETQTGLDHIRDPRPTGDPTPGPCLTAPPDPGPLQGLPGGHPTAGAPGVQVWNGAPFFTIIE